MTTLQPASVTGAQYHPPTLSPGSGAAALGTVEGKGSTKKDQRGTHAGTAIPPSFLQLELKLKVKEPEDLQKERATAAVVRASEANPFKELRTVGGRPDQPYPHAGTRLEDQHPLRER